MSASTIDRMLTMARGRVDGRQTRPSAKPAIRRSIPMRTFGDWNNPLPGFMEADLVSHGGENVAGSFAHTLVLTDIASGWTECVALAVRQGSWLRHGQRQRVHQRDGSGLLHGDEDRVHACVSVIPRRTLTRFLSDD